MATIENVWDGILEAGIVSEETLTVVTRVNGYTLETLNDVIFAVTGYDDLEQFLESE